MAKKTVRTASPGSLKLLNAVKEKTTLNSDGLAKLVAEHFPAIEDPDQFRAFAIGIGGAKKLWFVDHKEELDRVKRIEKAARTMWEEYNALPSRVMAHMNLGCASETSGQLAPITDILRNMMHEMTGRDPLAEVENVEELSPSPQMGGAINRAKKAISLTKRESHQRKANDGNDKAHLARIAVIIWEECSGGKAPLSPSASSRRGSFYAFLGDLIHLCGKKWGVEKTMSAYRVAYCD